MKIARKILPLIIVVLTVCLLASCGGNKNSLIDPGVIIGIDTEDSTTASSGSSGYYVINLRDDSGEMVKTEYISVANGNRVNVPTERGRTFKGYYSATGICYFDERGYQTTDLQITNDLTLYQRWENNPCTIFLNPDDGALDVSDRTIEATYGDRLSNFPVPEFEGHDFLGWYTNSGTAVCDARGVPLDGFDTLNKSYPISTEDKVSLIAKFEIQKFTVTLDYNQYYSTVNYDNVTLEATYGSKLGDLSKYNKDTGSSEIIGWSTNAGLMVEFSGEVTGDVTLYAMWRDYRDVQFVYAYKGNGDPLDVREKRLYKDSGGSVLLPDGKDNAGFALESWYTSAGFMGDTRVSSVSFSGLQDIYYGKWSETDYRLVFETDDGTTYDPITYEYGDAFDLPVPEERDESEFLGWCTKKDLSDEPMRSVTPNFFGDYTLYPFWRAYETEATLYVDSLTVGTATLKYHFGFRIKLPALEDTAVFRYWYITVTGEDGEEIIPLTDENGESLAAWDRKDTSISVFAKYDSKYTLEMTYQDPSTKATKTIKSPQPVLSGTVVNIKKPEALKNYSAEFYVGDELIGEGDAIQYTMPMQNTVVEIRYTLPRATEYESKYLGWKIFMHGGHYYTVIPGASSSWSDAKARCEFYGGHLATITSQTENDAIVFMLSTEAPGNYNFWLGGYDANGDNKSWKWVTGESFSYTNWHSGEPNYTSQPYLSYWRDFTDYTWADNSDASGWGYIIEWDRAADIKLPQTRTLTLADGTEVTLGIYTYSKHFYAVVKDAKTWLAAEDFAEQLGGHLATVTSEAENNYLLSLRGYNGLSNILIGATDYIEEGKWRWVTGEIFLYNNWNSGEPNDSGGVEDFAAMVPGWNDISASTSYPFVIEWDTSSQIGTKAYYFTNRQIRSAEDLAAIGGLPAGINVSLMKDIDMADVSWTPVNFSGIFYGNGHTISNLNVSSDELYTGLFATVTGTVEDLVLTNLKLTSTYSATSGNSYCGVIGQLNGGRAENITVQSGSIRSVYAETGGIVGMATNNAVITGCVNRASVTCENSSTGRDTAGTTGGILGWMPGNVSLIDCKNYGKVTGTWEVGGILGGNNVSVTVKNCENHADVVGTEAGGIVGNATRKAITLDGCVSTGLVTGTSAFGKYVGSGSATLQNLATIHIATPEQLLAIRMNAAEETYCLDQDLDMTDVSWTPFAFAAKLDGQGHKIKNLTVTSGNSLKELGMFTTLSGTVQNVSFENLKVESTYNDYSSSFRVGGLCATLTGTVSNVKMLSGSVSAASDKLNVGGIAGGMTGGAIKDSSNAMSVSGKVANVGGLVGLLENGSVTDSSNSGAITGTSSETNYHTGGVIGRWGGGDIRELTNSGKVTGKRCAGGIVGGSVRSGTYSAINLTNTGRIEGSENVGGIFGYLYSVLNANGNYTVTLTKLTNSGEIVNSGDYTGGIAGRIAMDNTYGSRTEALKIVNWKNTGNVSGENGYYAGGLVGYLTCEDYNWWEGNTVSGAKVSGTIKGKAYVGGFFGYATYICVNGNLGGEDSTTNEGARIVCSSAYSKTGDSNYYAYVGGYFGRIESGSYVSNLTNRAEIRYTGNGLFVGGIAGEMYITCSLTGTFSNLTNESDIASPANAVGGLFGAFKIINNINGDYTVTFRGWFNNGNISGTDLVGGLVGHLEINNTYGSRHQNVDMTYFENTGNVTGTSYNVGGVAGYFHGDPDYYSLNTIRDSSVSGKIQGLYRVGGFFGTMENLYMSNCSNEGAQVKATGSKLNETSGLYDVWLGGYAGYSYSVNFAGLTNKVNLTYNGEKANCRFVGGIAGYCERLSIHGSFTFENLTNEGTIQTNCDFVGGIFGYMQDAYSASANYTFTFRNFSNKGAVTGRNYVGGMIGSMYTENTYNSSKTDTAYLLGWTNSGNLSGTDHVGGLIGHVSTDTSASYITEYSSTGTVTATGTNKGTYFGSATNMTLK